MVILALIFYNLCFPVLFAFYLPVFLSKLVKRGDFKEGFWERFGIFSASKKEQLKNLQNPIWIHAVSVGETVAALSFIRQWSKREPNLEFVLSTTTSTGQNIARKQLPKNVIIIYCPIDFFICVLRALKIVNLQMLIIFEVEIWPNLIILAAWRKIRLALVNCRMSDKSTRNYARHRWFFNYVFSRFSIICTQTEEDARRIKTIIGNQPQVKVCNTMKFDQVTSDFQNNNPHRLVDVVFPDRNRIIFTAASTHPGEELIMIRAFKSMMVDFPSLRLILAPRHTERTYEVEKILQNEDIDYALLTGLVKPLQQHSSPPEGGVNICREMKKRVLLVDTMGELMGLFAVSDIVFMGKSLGINKGGHNIIEPAIFGKPIIFGKNMDNFREVAKIFKENNAAVEVEDEKEFLNIFHHLLADPVERERLSKISLATVEKHRGAIYKTTELIRNKNHHKVN